MPDEPSELNWGLRDPSRARLTCSAILFDMDGTIVDSNACVIRQWQRWAELHELSLPDVLRVSHGRRTLETMIMLAPHLKQPGELGRFLQQEERDVDGISAVPGALEIVSALPNFRWGIVTSSSMGVARSRLRCCGFPEPRVLITADDVEHGKPNPEPFLAAARDLGFDPSECLVFEDANSGIAAARAAGMQVVGVTFSDRETLACELQIKSFRQVSVECSGSLTVVVG